jgi:GTP-binding protein Era
VKNNSDDKNSQHESSLSRSVQCCGYVAIVGRPNVGKSTLLNNILGMKLSITSRKPQTTRHQILGVKTESNVQSIYVDTPGIHQRRGTAINKYMNRAATSVLNDVDIILLVVQAGQWTEEDQLIIEKLQTVKCPVVLVVNKIDKLENKKQLLPIMQDLSAHYKFSEIIPVSALNGMNVEILEEKLAPLLPVNEHIYSDDQITDRSMRFLASEIIREKLIRELGQELPYTSAVVIDKYEEDETIVHIHATIYVESAGQKSIIIGKKGARLKSIGTHARQDISKMVGSKIYLNLWVKVREGWSNDEQALRGLGYGE